MIEIFNKIRDIPYRIPLALNERDDCCSGKCMQLKSELEKLWINSRYRICEFLRSELNLPKKVLEVEHEDFSTHVYLEVKLRHGVADTIILDPTRDIWLKSVLPVNERDGKSNTTCAVKPKKLLSLEESHKIMTQVSKKETQRDFKRNWNFYRKLNDWFCEIRFS